MNRKDRRAQPKELQKVASITNHINSLTPVQARIADIVATERAAIIVDRYIQNFEKRFDRNMSAALIEYGIDYEDISGIQSNMSKMLLEDSEKSKKLEEGNFNMAEIEIKVLAAVRALLVTEVSKKDSIERLRDKFPRLSRSMLLNAYVKVKKELGLTENRISKEVVYVYLDKFADNIESKKAVTNLMKQFDFTESTAKTYYSKWKNQYMVAKVLTDPIAPLDKPIIKKNISTDEAKALRIIEVAKKRQCEELVAKTGQAPDPIINKTEGFDVNEAKGLKVIESKIVVIKTFKVEGENGVYVVDTVNGVTLSRDKMNISFENEEQLNEWVSEVKAVLRMVV